MIRSKFVHELVDFKPKCGLNSRGDSKTFGRCGLAAHLLNLTQERLETDSHQFGPLLENFICIELRKQATWSKERPELYHWWTHTQQEVDLVMEAGGRLVGVEVKASATVTSDDFKALRILAIDAKEKFVRGVVLYGGREVLPFGENLMAMPVSSLWRVEA